MIEREDALAGIPEGLRTPLISEFNAILRNFREHRWGPTGLTGGRFAEIVFSILKGHTENSFPPKPSKPSNFAKACEALTQTDANQFSKSVRLHIPRVLVSLYDIRNHRNIGHVGGDVDANSLDASYVVAASKWTMGELVRVFHNMPIEEAAQIIESLVEREIPLVFSDGKVTRVLDTSLSCADQTLVVLYSSSKPILDRALCDIIEYKNTTRYKSKILQELHAKRLVEYEKGSGLVKLLPPGARHVETNISLTF